MLFRSPITVLGKDSQYGRIVCGMCCQMSGPERFSRRSDSSSLDCTYKGSSPGQSVEPDTGQEWQPTTHRSHGDSAAIDDSRVVKDLGCSASHIRHDLRRRGHLRLPCSLLLFFLNGGCLFFLIPLAELGLQRACRTHERRQCLSPLLLARCIP